MKPDTAGDPINGLKWTRKTTRKISETLELTGTDITMCPCRRKGTMMVIAEITHLWKMGVKYMDSS